MRSVVPKYRASRKAVLALMRRVSGKARGRIGSQPGAPPQSTVVYLQDQDTVPLMPAAGPGFPRTSSLPHSQNKIVPEPSPFTVSVDAPLMRERKRLYTVCWPVPTPTAIAIVPVNDGTVLL